MTISYKVGSDAAIINKWGHATDEGVILGLNAITMPGLERTIITVEEFRNEFSRQFTGGGNYGTLGYSGNAVIGDLTGQDQLRAYLIARTQFTDTRAYFDLNDFLMCDLASDSISAMQVSKAMFGNADKNSVFPYDGEIIMNGAYAIFSEHTTAAAVGGYAFAGSTITDSGTELDLLNIQVGDTLQVDKATTAANDGQKTVVTVAAGVITMDSAFDTDEIFDATAGNETRAHWGRQ